MKKRHKLVKISILILCTLLIYYDKPTSKYFVYFDLCYCVYFPKLIVLYLCY